MFECHLELVLCFFFKQKTAYEMRISDWSSDVCSSDLGGVGGELQRTAAKAEPIAQAGVDAANAGGANIAEPVVDDCTDRLLADRRRRAEFRAGAPRFDLCPGRIAHDQRREAISRTAARRVGKDGCRTGDSRWTPE